MKALNLYGRRDIRFEESPKPIIDGKDDVIIRVKSAGICGSDISRYNKLGPYVEGMTFGHEFAGEVVEVGPDVKELEIGERVAGCPTFYCGKCISCQKSEFARCENLHVIGAYKPGSYAEYVKLPSENVVPIPSNVDYDTAAMIEPSAVVAHGFYRTNIQPGDDVAIMGCGGIGLLAIQWAKIFGAAKVYAIDIDPSKLELAKMAGADVVINSQEKEAHEQVLKHTNGVGVDIAVESAGTPITSAHVLALPKKGGQVVYLGIPYGDVNVERFYFEKIVRNELTVLGSWNAISAPFPGKEWSATVHYMSTGQLNVKPIITHKLSLSEGPDIFERIVNQEGTFGKVMFNP